MKRKILYSDIPRPYDAEAAKLIKAIGAIMLACIVLAALALIVGA